MKKILKLFVPFCICLALGTAVQASDWSIKEFNIERLSLPDEFISCSREGCDEALENLLGQNNFTHNTWVEQMMKPNSFYIYATDQAKGQTFYALCKAAGKKEITENKDGSKKHYLMADYNLIKTADEKSDFIKRQKENLIYNGISQDAISKIGWAELENSKTPYTEYVCKMGEEYFHCFETIYNADTIEFQFASPKAFSEDEIKKHLEIIENISYTEVVDYSEAIKIINDNLEKKLEEETHSGENTRVLRYALSFSIALVIAMAIMMAIKSQNAKRKRNRIIIDSASRDEEDTEE